MYYIRWDRTVKLFYFFVFLLFLSLLRLGYLQVFCHRSFTLLARDQNTFWVALEEVSRGHIRDRYGRSLTAGGREYRLAFFPSLVRSRERVEGVLRRYLSSEERAKVWQRGPTLLPVNLSRDEAIKMQNTLPPGLMVVEVEKRYRSPQPAANTVGYVGPLAPGEGEELSRLTGRLYRIGDLTGRSGLEKYYEAYLKGERPERVLRLYVDGLGRVIPGLGIREEKTVDFSRQDVYLTLDLTIQEKVEKILDRHRIKEGAVVVLDPANGDLLALASRPALDPRVPGRFLKQEGVFLDPAVQLYQPGSVFKIAVAAAALEKGVVKPEDKFFCAGEKDPLIPCYEKKGHGSLDFATAMAVSCNPVFARVGLLIGAEAIMEQVQRLGLDRQEIIGYPFPSDERQDWTAIAQPYNLANSGIGQGPVLATPVQVAAMTAAVANGGYYHQPRLVLKVVGREGTTVKFRQGRTWRALSPPTAAELKKMMYLVTTAGSGREAWVKGGSAGKTGSAQVGGKEKEIYAWFTGFAPYDRPRYVVTVLVKGGESGGKTAAPLFREIIQELLSS